MERKIVTKNKTDTSGFKGGQPLVTDPRLERKIVTKNKADTSEAKEPVYWSGVLPEWRKLLDTPDLADIVSFISQEPELTPPLKDIFHFARYTPPADCNVVIVAQDPYPGDGDATGMAFSTTGTVPPSLKNIYKCLLAHKLIPSIPTSGNLTHWAEQGVLLLNRSLTTIVGKSNIHAKLWDSYTTGLVKTLNRSAPRIYMLWGNDAQKLSKYIREPHIVLKWAHPSPLGQLKQKFIECDHFVTANDLLKKLGHKQIDWVTVVDEVKKRFKFDDRTHVVFTDGSCFPTYACAEAKGGYSASFELGPLKDQILYGCIENKKHFATNQRAEGMAIYRAMKHISTPDDLDKWDKLIIVTDSDFWIKMFTQFMRGWIAKGTCFTEKKNSDMTVPMWSLYDNLISSDKIIEFRHIKSHNKSGWESFGKHTYEYFCARANGFVDKFAGYARKVCEPGEHHVEKA